MTRPAASWRSPCGHRPVLDQAASAAAKHGLRAYDAVQLACGLAARSADPQVDGFLCFDGELRDAAGREGFSLTV